MIAKGMVEEIVSVLSLTVQIKLTQPQEVPTLAKAIFHEENLRSSIKIELGEEESRTLVDPRIKSEITGQRLLALASQCKVCSFISLNA
jgi:hypothetical protein